MQSKNYSLASRPVGLKPLEQISSPFQKSLSPGPRPQQIMNSPQNIQLQTLPNQQVYMAPPPMVRSASSTSIKSVGLQQQQLPCYQQQSPMLSPTRKQAFQAPPSPMGMQRAASYSPPSSNKRIVATNVQPPMLKQQQAIQQQNLQFSKVQGFPPATMMGGSKIFSGQPPLPTQLQALPSNVSMQHSGSQAQFMLPQQQIAAVKPQTKIMNFQQIPQPPIAYAQPPISPASRIVNNSILVQDPERERRIQQLEAQNRSLLDIISKLENENPNQGPLNNISQDLALLQEQITYYQAEIKEKDEQIYQWKSQCDSLSGSQSQYSLQIQELSQQLSNSKQTIQKLSSQLQSLSSNQSSTYEIEKLKSRIKQYESQVAKQNEDILYLRNYTTKIESSSNNSEELRQLKIQKDQLQDSYRRIEQNYKTEISAYEKEIKRLKEQHEKEIAYIKKSNLSSTTTYRVVDGERETVKRTGHYKPKQYSQLVSSSYNNDYTEQPSIKASSNLKHSQFQHGSYKSYSRNDDENEENRKVVRTYVVKGSTSDAESGSNSLRQSSVSRSRLDRSQYNTTMRAAN